MLTYNDTGSFTKLYMQLNEKEGKQYTDEELANLPSVKHSNNNRQEWAARKNSLKRLLYYLKQKRDQLHILEVGCGNGWLSAQLASGTKNNITGIDIDDGAIEQAKRVFGTKENLEYVQFDFNNEYFEERKFDIVIIAASIQYFYSFKKTIATAMEHLTLQGEIHILDSVLYRQHEIAAAKQQTANYLHTMEMDELAPFYFYHSMEELKKFNHTILYDPSSWVNRLLHNGNPFYHVVIKNRYQ
jgi:2-polyprenyl-3-methyl-5-hydroxy-6-metoxy-1,4-benzoquinol methylase